VSEKTTKGRTRRRLCTGTEGLVEGMGREHVIEKDGKAHSPDRASDNGDTHCRQDVRAR
jgi:hypothetical protein